MEEEKLTALSGVGVVMNRETARAVEPFPTPMTDVLARFIVITLLQVRRAGRFWRRDATPGI